MGHNALPFNSAQAYNHAANIVGFGKRPVGSSGEAQTRQYIVNQLSSYGYSVRLQQFMIPGGTTSYNIIATKNADQYGSNKWLALGAHYDSVNNVGANDNASGVAVLLELARDYSNADSPYAIEFVAFGSEENLNSARVSNLGASAYLANLDTEKRSRLSGYINIDMIGWKGSLLSISNLGISSSWLLDWASDSANKLGIKLTTGGWAAANSDYSIFERGGIPSLSLGLFSYPYHHKPDDNLSKVSVAQLSNTGRLVNRMLLYLPARDRSFDYYYVKTSLFTILSAINPKSINLNWDSGYNGWAWEAGKPVSGDFNGDGKDDIAVLYGYGGARSRLWVFLNNGSGGFNPPVVWWDSGPNNWDWGGSKLISGDFNGDGKDDIAVLYGYLANRQSKAWVFTSNGSVFDSPKSWWDSGPNNWDWGGSKLISGDFNGDGKDDLLVMYGYSRALTRAWFFSSSGSNLNLSLYWDSGVGNWESKRSKFVSGKYDNDNSADLAIFYNYSSYTIIR